MASAVKNMGVALGLVATGYGGSVVYEIYNASREESRLLHEDLKLKAAAALAERRAGEEEKTVGAMEADVVEQKKGLDLLEKDLNEVRRRMNELESLRASRLAKLNYSTSAIEEARRRMKQLREDAVRDREAATELDAALKQAKEMTHQKELLWNPANHPLVRRWTVHRP